MAVRHLVTEGKAMTRATTRNSPPRAAAAASSPRLVSVTGRSSTFTARNLRYAAPIRRPSQLVTAVALAGGLLVAQAGVAGAEGRLPSNPTPVNYVNYYRDTARLAPVPENATLSDAARKHATYLVKNDEIAHTETVGNPFYTPEG